MARSREARMLRGRQGPQTARAQRRQDASRAAEHWPELFQNLLRRDPDEDLVDRLERHWLPDIRQGAKAGDLPEEARFFLKGWALEMLAEERIHEAMASGGELQDLSDRMRAVEEEHGAERGEPWWPGEGPDRWETLRRQWQERVDAVFLDTLEAHGEEDLARLFREDPEDFERRMEAGRRYVFGE